MLGGRGWYTALQLTWLTLFWLGWNLGWLVEMRKRLLLEIILLWLLNSLIVGALILIEIICSWCLCMLLQRWLEFSYWCTWISYVFELLLNVWLLLSLNSRIRCNWRRPVQKISSVTYNWRSQRRKTTTASWRILKVLCSCAIPCKLWLFSIFKRLFYEVKTLFWDMSCLWTALILSLANWPSNFFLRRKRRCYDKISTACKTFKSAWNQT